ncbi:Derlin-3 [Arthrobotrys entomopaga]|nr:Derlin-3 [Arthrobotrys entomopaga]
MGVAMAYSWGQRNRGRNVKFFFVQIKAQWMPFAILGITAIQAPGMVFILLSGIISAHAYEFLTVIWPRFGGGTNLLPTPSWFKFSFEGGPGTSSGGIGGERGGYGHAFDARSRDAPAARPSQGMFSGSGAGRSTGTSSGQTTSSAWRNRGTGHRLGSD